VFDFAFAEIAMAPARKAAEGRSANVEPASVGYGPNMRINADTPVQRLLAGPLIPSGNFAAATEADQIAASDERKPDRNARINRFG